MKSLYQYLQTYILTEIICAISLIHHACIYGHKYTCISIAYFFLLYVTGKLCVESRLKAFKQNSIGCHETTDYHLSGPAVLLEWKVQEAEILLI